MIIDMYDLLGYASESCNESEREPTHVPSNKETSAFKTIKTHSELPGDWQPSNISLILMVSVLLGM